MGLRGRGARPKKRADPGEKPRRRRPTWKKPGLSRAERVIKFIESLPVTKGRLRGKKMRLLPEQRAFIEAVFAVDHAGLRKVSLAILSEPKGNGKSSLVAAICLAFLLGPEAEERGAIYSASIDRGKASIIYDEMKAVIHRVLDFEERTNCQDFKKTISVLSGDGFDSVYEALSGDDRRSQGLSPTMWAYDELGEAPDGKLLSVLLESEGKRLQTLGIVLSTQAASDDHPLSKLIDDALTGSDPSVYLQLHTAPPDADPWSDETLKACNPAWGRFRDEKALLKARDRAQRIPAFESGYRNWRLNQRVDSNAESRIMTAGIWNQNAGPVDRAALAGRRCFGGLDLSGKHDLSALVLVFPDDGDEPVYDVLPFFWTPEGQLAARQKREADLFKLWISQGHMIAVPGPTIRTGWIAAELARVEAEFDICGISFDRWRIDDLKHDLTDADCNVPLMPRGQGFKDQSPDIEVLTELALTGRLRHAGHPVLTAAISHAVTVSDPSGNVKCDKEKSRGPVRIDGAVSLAMAVGLASRTPPKRPSVYEGRGLISVRI